MLKPKGSYDGESVGRVIAIATRQQEPLDYSQKRVCSSLVCVCYIDIRWVTWEERPSSEELPPSDQTIGNFYWEHFLDL